MSLPLGPLAAGNVTEERLIREVDDGRNWLVKGGNARGQHYSPLASINSRNVSDLGLAWSADIPAPDGIATTPIIVDGVIYVSAAYSVVFAVDAETGAILWQFDPDVRSRLTKRPRMSWTARASRGVAVWDGRVYATTADCRLIAIDAGTGEEVWSKSTCDIDLGYGISDSPYVGGGKVFVGNNGSESGYKNRGYVSAYDADTGELDWRFYTVPSDRPEENTTPAMKMAAKTWSGDALAEFGGGGSNWNEMTYDPESGLLFFGTAGALPYTWHVRSPDGGDNLFLSSVLAVDADTGEYVWHYQTVPQDSWEYNATMNIALAELEFDGERRRTLLIAPKNGFHYVLDRMTGELLAADKFAKVNWATHVNLETGRPVYDPAAAFWDQDEGEATFVWPNMWGAHSWNPMAWHPELELSYIPVVDVPSIVSDYEDGDYSDTLEMLTEVDGKPFSPGKLVAFDPKTGRARWTFEYELPFNGGVMATGGNLVFQGDAKGYFSAFAADTGERLWTVKTGSSISAAPASYSIDGEQFVVIPIGTGGGLQWVYPQMHSRNDVRGPTRLLAFSLDGAARLPVFEPVARELPDQPTLEASAETIARGKQLYGWECSYCHGNNAATRSGGTVPDLRYATAETHSAWAGIVVGGAKAMNGMPRFDLDVDEAEAIRAYVLSESEKLRDRQSPR